MDRRAVEAELDRLVAENRFTIAVVFPLAGALSLVASAEGLLGPLAFHPLLVLTGTLVMRLPLVAGLAPLVDRRAAVALTALVAFTYAVELLAVATGLPYGEFSYGVSLGPMLAGTVPAALPAFYLPLVANSYLLVLALGAGRRRRTTLAAVVAGVVALVGVDLVLDPAAVALGFWSYAGGGAFYGVPWTNFAGWLASGAVAVALLAAAFDAEALRDRLADCPYLLDDLVSFVVLWTAVNAYYANAVPVALALGLFVVLLRSGRVDLASWRRTPT